MDAEEANVQGQEVIETQRDAEGKFLPGQSGNARGRPKGSKNRVTLLKLMAEEAVREGGTKDMLKVAQLIIEQALEGDARSQKLVWEAIMSKGTADDKSQGKEKVEITITGAAPPEVKDVGEIIDQEEDTDAAE